MEGVELSAGMSQAVFDAPSFMLVAFVDRIEVVVGELADLFP